VNGLLRNYRRIGFPLGFVFCINFSLTRSQRDAILYATLVGAALGFVGELLQAYIPQRDSGTTDIITNTLGAVLGAVIARPRLIRPILPKAMEPRQQRAE
jgi:VanZ family protein